VTSSEVLLLRLSGPLMSFGGVKVDEHNVTARFPGRSLLAGLIANALGWDHGDFDRLDRLQSRLRHAARCDRAGHKLVDFHTVDLGQDFLREGWTTYGRPAGRAGGTAKTGTHIRYRHYWADAVVTVAISLNPFDEEPTLSGIERALLHPARPLFLGRKTCLPSEPIVLGRLTASSLRTAIAAAPLHHRHDDAVGGFPASWPKDDEPAADEGRLVPAYDERDWRNQIHAGRRLTWEGWIRREEIGHG